MVHKTGKDMDFKIDNASGSLTSIKGYVPQVDLEGILEILQDNGLGDSDVTGVPGLHSGSAPLNFHVDSTTDAIFGPLLASGTSVTKTYALNNGASWYTGEAWPENVRFSGTPATLVVGSCTLTLDGAQTRTSVEPS